MFCVTQSALTVRPALVKASHTPLPVEGGIESRESSSVGWCFRTVFVDDILLIIRATTFLPSFLPSFPLLIDV